MRKLISILIYILAMAIIWHVAGIIDVPANWLALCCFILGLIAHPYNWFSFSWWLTWRDQRWP